MASKRKKINTYGIKKMPAVVIDGKIADCCVTSSSTMEGLKSAGVGVSV